MLLVQIPKALDLHLWLWWLRACSPWQWTLYSQSPSLVVNGLFLDSRHLCPPMEILSTLDYAHTILMPKLSSPLDQVSKDS